jgi:hypothetical protein
MADKVRRSFVLVWLAAIMAIVVGGAVVFSRHSFIEPVFLFGSPLDVIVYTAVIILCGSVAVGFAVVGVRMWIDRRTDRNSDAR